MALEAVVLQPDLFGYNSKDLYNFVGGNWGSEIGFGLENVEGNGLFGEGFSGGYGYGNWMSSYSSLVHLQNPKSEGDITSCHGGLTNSEQGPRQKRRRCKSRKNKEDVENQRMTHIAVERNRRKQMNEYLSALRSLMPESFVQRGDQASIIGGAINFVKELEQKLHILGSNDHNAPSPESSLPADHPSETTLPFSEFFTYPQYSTSSTKRAVADVEVTVVESHASMKIRSKRRPKQLLELVSGLQSMRLTVLHLNVTTVNQIVLYSISVKIEEDCRLSSVDDIATAVHELLVRMDGEAVS